MKTLLYNPLVSPSQANITDLSPIFGNMTGAFVLYTPQENQYIYYNEERCNHNFPPMSTFKIPNSIISLETGAIADETITVSYDFTQTPHFKM
jgi:beta-lactamase class D